MKKILLTAIAILLLGTLTTQAALVNVNTIYDTVANTLSQIPNAVTATFRAATFTATSTTATSTFPNINSNKLQAGNSGGFAVFSNSGTPVSDFGAGGGSNATFFGGVNINGQTRIATSMTGVLRADNGIISTTTGGTGTPGGGNGQLQFNNAGSFGGTSTPSVTAINATNTGAVSRFAGLVTVGTTTSISPLTIQGNIYQMGNYNKWGDVASPFPCANCDEFWGSNNTFAGVSRGVGNINSGAAAWSGFFANNNLVDVNVLNYMAWTLNSSNYSTTTFGTAFAFPNLMMMENSVGAMSFMVSSTTQPQYFNWLTGKNTTDERMRLTNTGFLGIGTTSPVSTLSVVGTSTLSATSTTAFRVLGGNGIPVFVVDSSTNPTFGVVTTLGRGSLSYTSTGVNFIISNQTSGSLAATINNQQGRDILMQSVGVDALVMQGATRNIGIGTSSPSARFTVQGDMRLTGLFADSSSSTGAVGSVLTSTATGTQWRATSTLGISGGGGGFSDPLTTNGDIIARIAGVTTRLGQGTDGQFLGVSGGVLGYFTPAGGGGGGSFSTTTDIVGDGAAQLVNFVTTDVMFGGSASTSAKFLFDKDGSKLIIASTSARATSTFANNNESQSVQFGVASTSGAPLVRGLHWSFASATAAVVSAVSTVLEVIFTLPVEIISPVTSMPLFNISTSTATTSQLFRVTATTTTLRHSSALSYFQDTGARVQVGISGYHGRTDTLDTLVVSGTWRQHGWSTVDCPLPVGRVAISANGVIGCGGFAFTEEGVGTLTFTSTAGSGFGYGRLAITTATNDGAGVFVNSPGGTGWMRFATSTPSFEADFRIPSGTNWGTSSIVVVGYSNLDLGGTNFHVQPTAGCYFIATTTTNWLAFSSNGTASTYTDTGVAATTTGQWIKGRIDADADGCRFYTQATESGTLTQAAYHTTNLPTTTDMNIGAHFGRGLATNTPNLDVMNLNMQWRKMLPSR